MRIQSLRPAARPSVGCSFGARRVNGTLRHWVLARRGRRGSSGPALVYGDLQLSAQDRSAGEHDRSVIVPDCACRA